MKTLRIEIELIFTSEDREQVDAKEIEDTIISNESEFYPRMGVLCALSDRRANLIEGSLVIEELEFNNEGGVASVVFDYEAYYGCKDMDHSDAIQDDWEFEIKGNKLIFVLEIPEIDREDEI